MLYPLDLTAEVFGRWKVVSYAGGRKWNCLCECGQRRRARRDHLTVGASRSCGCLHAELAAARRLTHGCARTKKHSPEYRAWANAKDRCFNPNTRNYASYGGRGITMCDEWAYSFAAFLAAIGPRPSPQHSLDRYPNNDGHYEPGNVRWATRAQQGRNLRTNRILQVGGERLCITDAAQKYGRDRKAIARRLKKGLSSEVAVGLP